MKFKILLLFLALTYINCSFSQTFIPLDDDTFEFIDDVNYQLFSNNTKVFTGICTNETPTTLPSGVVFDSISFSKVDYKSLGLKKEGLTKLILLTKNIIHLDEVVITSSKKDALLLGEHNRFVKKGSRPILKDLDYGISFENNYDYNLVLKKLLFYVEKIKYKTAYKIALYEFDHTPIGIGREHVSIKKKLYETETLYLYPQQKGAIEIPLTNNQILEKSQSIFITLELIDYYDAENNKIIPIPQDFSKLKFQLSNEANYYSKMQDITTGKLTSNLININAMIKYDFAFGFFKKPHKSILLCPALVVYASKTE